SESKLSYLTPRITTSTTGASSNRSTPRPTTQSMHAKSPNHGDFACRLGSYLRQIRSRWRKRMSLCWAAAKKDDDLDPENGHAVKPEQLRTDTEQENDLNNNRNLTSRTLLRVGVLALITLSAA